MGPFDEQDLLDFLREHELFQVIESPTGALGDEASQKLKEAGFNVGPSVILITRIPSARELAAQFDAQIEVLVGALQRALGEAQLRGDVKRVGEVTSMVERAEKLREVFKALT